MLDWLGDIPDVAWGAVVTGLFLTGQQWLNGRRDDRRRTEDASHRQTDREEQAKQAKAEREHQAKEAAAERQHQLALRKAEDEARAAEAGVAYQRASDDAQAALLQSRADLWRNERRAAHLALIPLLEGSRKTLEENAEKLKFDSNGHYLEDPGLEMLDSMPTATREEISRALANVEIIGSERSRQAARECRDALRALDMWVWAASAGFSINYTKQKLVTRRTEVRDTLAAYIDWVRADLGTAD